MSIERWMFLGEWKREPGSENRPGYMLGKFDIVLSDGSAGEAWLKVHPEHPRVPLAVVH